jgi:glycosyltransferase involved in cell wall biosynthesis
MNNFQPHVSVVIPAYKARNYLCESLASVAAQDYTQGMEVLVIDDASPEPIDDIIAAYQKLPHAPPLRIIRHEKNQGLGASRNTGIREASGEFIAFLDHDDVWHENHVSSVMSAISEQAADFGFCSVILFEKDTQKSLRLWGPQGGDLDAKLDYRLFLSNFITPSSVIARRASLLELGGFNTDPKIHMCEDLDLWLRSLQCGHRFAYANTATTYYRKHADAATSRLGYMAYQSARVREIHFAKVGGPFFRKCSHTAMLWWDAVRAIYSAESLKPTILARAIAWSLPVPWEMARGLIRLWRVMRPV